MFPKPAERCLIAILFLLLPPGCAWIPGPPDAHTQPVVTNQPQPQASIAPPDEASTTPPAQSPQVKNDIPSDVSTDVEQKAARCHASKPGQIIGFEAFYAATLKGEDVERLYISAAPGATPGDSYGLAGDAVEAIATALDDTCTAWMWVKWPETDYRGWLPATAVDIDP